MAAILTIRDGDPHWWNSPDIWVVPGDDPNGAPGSPVAGNPAYLWARAHNTGDQPVLGARIDYYWSNPATGVLRSNSHLVGSAFVDLEPGETQDVLCLIPWTPQIVNEGHECLVCEIIHAADPLPVPPPDAFNPPAHRQIAQKNLTVLQMQSSMMVKMIQLSAPKRTDLRVAVHVETGGKIDEESLRHLGIEGFRPAEMKRAPRVSLSEAGGCGESGDETLELALASGTSRAVYLKIHPGDLPDRTYLPVHVISRSEREVVGGITYLLVSRKEG